MKKLKNSKVVKFLKAFLLFLQMYRYGFFFSDNTHIDYNGNRWGFYRFNYITEPGLYDIDFEFNKKENSMDYFHVHGRDFRLKFNGMYKMLKNRQFAKKT